MEYAHFLSVEQLRRVTDDPTIEGFELAVYAKSGPTSRLLDVALSPASCAWNNRLLLKVYDGADERSREVAFLLDDDLSAPFADLLPRALDGAVLDGQYWLLLEKLAPPETRSITGAEMTVADMDRVLALAASFHGRTWGSVPPILRRLKNGPYYAGEGGEHWRSRVAIAAASWAKGRDRPLQWAPGFRAMIDDALESADFSQFLAFLRRYPCALAHNDFHVRNVLFAPDRTVLIDWPEVGPFVPMADVGQFLISDARPGPHYDGLRERIRTHYYDNLPEHARKSFSFDLCVRGIAEAGLSKWVVFFALLSAMDAFDDAFMQYFHDQMIAFAEYFDLPLKSFVSTVY